MTCLQLTADTYTSAVTTSVALGEAIPGMEVHVMAGDSPDTGELVIVGPQLAEGYWNDPEKTARAFRVVDFPGGRRRAYFSGDLVRRANGHLYFQGRTDHQVKIDGFRLELEEVASAIRSLGWDHVVVLKVDGHLTAVIENKQGLATGAAEVRLQAQLKHKLDRHAVPARFVFVDEFPRNLNDKIDVGAVSKLAQAQIRTIT
jgi:acyl-coenzyme A synthetase/AMP-(fatty) acid ligase